HYRVHQTEDCRVRFNAKSQRENRNGGKTGIPEHGANRESQVCPQLVHSLQFLSLAAFVLGRLHGSEFQAGSALCLAPIDTVAQQVIYIGIDMKTEFGVHVTLEPLAAEDPYDPSGTAPRTFATTIEKRFHDSFLAFSRFRPAAVRA